MIKEKNVLILEDSPTQAVQLEYVLEKAGYSTATTVDGIEALEYLEGAESIRPDIIISDIIMPGMNGFDFCREIKKDIALKDIPVILLTALSEPSDVISGLECGADNFITKPYKDDYLISRVKYLLENFAIRKNKPADHGVDILFSGKKYNIISERTQILDLLVSTFENTVQKNEELNSAVSELKEIQKKLIIVNNEAETAKEKLKALATLDALTGIYNRRAFKEIATKMIALSDRKKRKIAVLHIDIDNFKSINDSLGHAGGDEVLKSVGLSLSKTLRKEDIVARIGGDEFAVILLDLSGVEEALIVAQKIVDSFKAPLLVNKEKVFATLSLGVSFSKESTKNSYSELLKEADLAMFEAKKSGKSQFKLFSKQIKEQYNRMHAFESELQNGIRNNDFYMCYQPIINLSNDKIEGAESLVRWESKKLGNVSPDEFIRFAEDSKQIHEIGHMVMQMVLKQCAAWNAQGVNEKFVSYNISPVQFERTSFIKEMIDLINEYKINPKNLVVEITETAFSQFLKTETLLKMREKNMLIAIDDFGSGYSSMNRLLQLPIDFMKIDGEYIRDVASNKKYQEIVKSILNIAKSLKIKSIAECVETKEQVEFLKENDCDYAQGYYYHKPMSPEDIVKLMK